MIRVFQIVNMGFNETNVGKRIDPKKGERSLRILEFDIEKEEFLGVFIVTVKRGS